MRLISVVFRMDMLQSVPIGKDRVQAFPNEPGMHGDPSRVSRQPQSVEAHRQEIARIKARFARDPQWAETHPHEAKSVKAQEELALYLIDVKPPTPEVPASPKYHALQAYTKYHEEDFAVLTAPDYERYDPDTGKYPTEETNQKANEAGDLLEAIAGERRANAAFDAAYRFYRDIGFTTFMAELYKPQESSERMHAALARTNNVFREALDTINNSPSEQPEPPQI